MKFGCHGFLFLMIIGMVFHFVLTKTHATRTVRILYIINEKELTGGEITLFRHRTRSVLTFLFGGIFSFPLAD